MACQALSYVQKVMTVTITTLSVGGKVWSIHYTMYSSVCVVPCTYTHCTHIVHTLYTHCTPSVHSLYTHCTPWPLFTVLDYIREGLGKSLTDVTDSSTNWYLLTAFSLLTALKYLKLLTGLTALRTLTFLTAPRLLSALTLLTLLKVLRGMTTLTLLTALT